jgi:predicted enzyme related to lactoylglutathione lyase
MSAPIVYFEIAGPDGERLREFYAAVFGWSIDGGSTISEASTGGLRGGLREDPAGNLLGLAELGSYPG